MDPSTNSDTDQNIPPTLQKTSVGTKSRTFLVLSIIFVPIVVLIGYFLIPNYVDEVIVDKNTTGDTNTVVTTIDDSTIVASSGMDIKINGSLTIENKITFTEKQLVAFESDMTLLYLKYQNQDKNVEPLKSEYSRQLDAIFLKNLAIPEVTKNLGILFYPEIAKILSDIKNKYPTQSQSVTATAVSSSANGIVLSNIDPKVVSIADLDKYTSTALTFKIANDANAKSLCHKEFNLDEKGVDVFEPRITCDGYYVKNGVYSDKYFFSNFKSVTSGSYETRNGKTYFENEGINRRVIDFYVKDTNVKESNRLRFVFTR